MVLSATAARPKVGVGVFITSAAHPGCVLLGQRRGSAGAGTWALPGGHLEFGESWALCAEREVYEETGLRVRAMRCATVLNAVDVDKSYHYLVIMMACVTKGEPQNLEPDKCEGWRWCEWSQPLPEPLFLTLDLARRQGVDPFATSAQVADEQASAAPSTTFHNRPQPSMTFHCCTSRSCTFHTFHTVHTVHTVHNLP